MIWRLVLPARRRTDCLRNNISKGVAIYRLRNHRTFPPPLHPAISSAILVALFAAPADWPDWYNLVMVMLVFPPLLIASANCEPVGRVADMCKFSGWLSYPLYTIHMPIVFFAMGAIKLGGRFVQIPIPFTELLFLALTLGAAYLFGRFYDEPVRRWLNGYFGARGRHVVPQQLKGWMALDDDHGVRRPGLDTGAAGSGLIRERIIRARTKV